MPLGYVCIGVRFEFGLWGALPEPKVVTEAEAVVAREHHDRIVSEFRVLFQLRQQAAHLVMNTCMRVRIRVSAYLCVVSVCACVCARVGFACVCICG